MKDLEEFGKRLANKQTDTQLKVATVKDAEPMIRESYYDRVTPNASGASDAGLKVTFETASGRTFNEWFEEPAKWDMVMSDLVLLLEYWDLHPGDIDRLGSDDHVFEVPVAYEKGNPTIDWQSVEQTVNTSQLEERDNVS